MILSWPIPVLVMAVLSHLDIVLAQNNTAQCVQVTGIHSPEPCLCIEMYFEFSMEGKTSVEDKVVNIAFVLDGSSSVESEHFDTEKEFAKILAASFAESNLFANGGTASYVQFSRDADGSDTGTFYSLDDFNDFVDNNTYIGGDTNISAGIDAANKLLNTAPDASAAFMVVVINGDDDVGSNVTKFADDARADGITLMAIGVGDDVADDTLLDIAGTDEYVFRADCFELLLFLVDDVVGASTVSCPATDVKLAVTYGATVEHTNFPDATINGTLVTFNVDNLEDNHTPFSVLLNSCGTNGSSFHPVEDIEYNDDQENSPDFTALLNTTIDTCLEEYTDDIIQEYTDDIVQEFTDDIVQEYTDDIIQEYTDDIVQEFTDDIVQEYTDDIVQEYTDDIVQEYTDDIVQAYTDDIVQAE